MSKNKPGTNVGAVTAQAVAEVGETKTSVTVMEAVTTQRVMQYIDRGKILAEEKDNTRDKIDVNDPEFQGLVIDIRNRGILEPILVRPFGKDSFKVVAGYRRVLAADHHKFVFEGSDYECKALASIPCVVLDGVDDAEALETNIVENGQRVDISPYETAAGLWRLEKLYKAKGLKLSSAQIAERLGKSTSYVYKLLQSKNLLPKWQQAWKEGSITTPRAFALAADDKDKQQELYDEWLPANQSGGEGSGGENAGGNGAGKPKKLKRFSEEKTRLFMEHFEKAEKIKVSGKWQENSGEAKKLAKMIVRTLLGELEHYPLAGYEPAPELADDADAAG